MRMSELVRRHKKVFRQLTADIYEEASRRGWYRQNPNPGGQRHRFSVSSPQELQRINGNRSYR